MVVLFLATWIDCEVPAALRRVEDWVQVQSMRVSYSYRGSMHHQQNWVDVGVAAGIDGFGDDDEMPKLEQDLNFLEVEELQWVSPAVQYYLYFHDESLACTNSSQILQKWDSLLQQHDQDDTDVGDDTKHC